MSSGTERLNRIWREQGDAAIERLCDDIASLDTTTFASMPRAQVLELARNSMLAWQQALETDDPAPLLAFARGAALERAAESTDIADIMQVIDTIRKHIWGMMAQIYRAGDWDMDLVEQIEYWLHEERKATVSSYVQTWHEAQSRLAEREQAIEDQGRLIQQLSTPIVPIHEGILVLPLVGVVDPRRATQIMEAVLEKIVEYQADVLILDITGVPVVDTSVANYIIQMARAVTLLGSRVVLVGIGSEIAQTMVQLGVDLRNITTLANLQAGIAYALAQQGYKISPVDRA
jgi:rsbT co-antagonist protein RsbR